MDNSIKDISIKDIGIMQDKIIEDFDLFDDWADKYRYLISLGNDLPEYPKDKMTEQYFVHGCQSQVWFYASLNSNGNMSLFATSDAAIVKGLIGLLLSIFDESPGLFIFNLPDFILSDLSLLNIKFVYGVVDCVGDIAFLVNSLIFFLSLLFLSSLRFPLLSSMFSERRFL